MHIALVGPVATLDVRHLLAHAPTASLRPAGGPGGPGEPAWPAGGAGEPAWPAGYGGAPVLATLIQALLQLGHRVTAITTSNDLPLRADARLQAEGPGFTLVWCPMRRRAWPFNGTQPGRIVDLYRLERRGLREAIRASGAEVVHAHWSYEFAWAALQSGLPHLITCHDSPLAVARLQQGWRRSAYRWLRAAMAWHVLRRAHHVTTVSPYMAQQVKPLCRAPLVVVPNPVADAVFDQERQLQAGRARILMVCNGWGPLKNPQPALQAFALLAAQRPQAELVLLGEDFGPGGAAERWWHAAAATDTSAATPQVRCIGAVPHAEVVAWMARSDVLLHPSREESFGAVLAEALAVGLPVVAGRSSGAVPWVVGTHGRLVDVMQPAAMAAALAELLDNPALRADLGRQGRLDMAKRFRPVAVARQYVARLTLALAQSQARGAAKAAAPLDEGR